MVETNVLLEIVPVVEESRKVPAIVGSTGYTGNIME
jgi:hypothetical protein